MGVLIAEEYELPGSASMSVRFLTAGQDGKRSHDR